MTAGQAPATEGSTCVSENGTRTRLLVLLLSLCVLAACGSSGDDEERGSELIDAGTFAGSAPEHIDPALSDSVEAYQVVNALFDGLTDIDASDPAHVRIVPHVAKSYGSNDDATQWTFTLRDDVFFSNGEQVLPSSFARAWERATEPGFAGAYGYLFKVIEGGAEKLDGEARTMTGVSADDSTMTLSVKLVAPYSNFDALVSYQTFFPVPSEVDHLEDQGDWEDGRMVGNGPYMLASPRNEREIVLVRNDRWAGDAKGSRWPDRVERIVFRVSDDPDSAYNAFEAGEADTASIPPGRAEQARADHGTTLDVSLLASSHFLFNERNPVVGGPGNQLLRQAISQAIDRDEINNGFYGGTRITPGGLTPPGIPGATQGLCDYCTYDPDAARAAFGAWQEAGNSQREPLPIQFNANSGFEGLVQIVIDDLARVGIRAVADPRDPETYPRELNEGACVFCRAGWTADFPAYDNFMYNLFHSDALNGNNYGYVNPKFDAVVDQARSTVDPGRRAELFQDAERIVLNEETGVVPISWYRGEYAYDRDKIASFPQTPFELILWEQVQLAG